MKTIKHNIGAILKLPVQHEVTVKGRRFYIVRYEDRLCRVAMEDWQVGQDAPSTLLCRLKSINDFGFPEFVQADSQKETIKTESSGSLISDFMRKFSLAEKAKKVDASPEDIISQSAYETNSKGLFTSTPKASLDIKTIASGAGTYPIDFNDRPVYDYFWREQSEDFAQWLIASGGVERRIDILIALAEHLSAYHRCNKVYKDLCPDFVNAHVTKEGKVKANLTRTDYMTSGFDEIFVFASVAAPEIINKVSPNTPMSDCYTFAIIVHELLAFCHPFIGDDIVNHKKDLKDAYLGKLPWIDSADDSSNRLTYRKCDTIFTTEKIRQLFAETFVLGKYSPMDRPSIHRWTDALYDAKAHLHRCNKCNTGYLVYEDAYCPFCDAEPEAVIQVVISRIDKKFDLNELEFLETEMELYTDEDDSILLSDKEYTTFSTQQLLVDNINVRDILSLSVNCLSDDIVSVVVEPLSGYSFYAANMQRQLYSQKIEKPTKVTFSRKSPKTLILALNELTTPQRVFTIKLN